MCAGERAGKKGGEEGWEAARPKVGKQRDQGRYDPSAFSRKAKASQPTTCLSPGYAHKHRLSRSGKICSAPAGSSPRKRHRQQICFASSLVWQQKKARDSRLTSAMIDRITEGHEE